MTNREDEKKNERELFTIVTFMEKYSMPYSSVYAEIKKGKLKTVKHGSRRLIKKEDAEAWRNTLPPYTEGSKKK